MFLTNTLPTGKGLTLLRVFGNRHSGELQELTYGSEGCICKVTAVANEQITVVKPQVWSYNGERRTLVPLASTNITELHPPEPVLISKYLPHSLKPENEMNKQN